jgi:hypothetical protein
LQPPPSVETLRVPGILPNPPYVIDAKVSPGAPKKLPKRSRDSSAVPATVLSIDDPRVPFTDAPKTTGNGVVWFKGGMKVSWSII